MIVFELDTDRGDAREIIWLGNTRITGSDKKETDSIYEQLTAHDCFLDEEEKGRENWGWPFLRINSGGAKEYACRHGVGHGGIHGCEGCCSDPGFPGRNK